jgi:hypothetical protein
MVRIPHVTHTSQMSSCHLLSQWLLLSKLPFIVRLEVNNDPLHSYPSAQAQACLSARTTARRPAATGGKLLTASILTHLSKPKHAYPPRQLPAGQPLLVASCQWHPFLPICPSPSMLICWDNCLQASRCWWQVVDGKGQILMGACNHLL